MPEATGPDQLPGAADRARAFITFLSPQSGSPLGSADTAAEALRRGVGVLAAALPDGTVDADHLELAMAPMDPARGEDVGALTWCGLAERLTLSYSYFRYQGLGRSRWCARVC
jgi:hypothetical protein